jgi:hypothetical protein
VAKSAVSFPGPGPYSLFRAVLSRYCAVIEMNPTKRVFPAVGCLLLVNCRVMGGSSYVFFHLRERCSVLILVSRFYGPSLE